MKSIVMPDRKFIKTFSMAMCLSCLFIAIVTAHLCAGLATALMVIAVLSAIVWITTLEKRARQKTTKDNK